MKKIILLLLVFIIHYSLFITNCKSQWESDVRLTNAPDTSWTSYHYNNIASNGNFVHVVWYDNRDGNFEIYYKRSTDAGVTWGVDTRLTNDPDNSIFPSCTVNGSVVHVAWFDKSSGAYQIYYKRSTDAGVTWGADILLTNAIIMTPTTQYLHLSSSGLLMFIAWNDNRDGNYEIYCKCSTDGGLTWGTDTRLTNYPDNSVGPCVAVSGKNVHIVWMDMRNGTYEIYYKRSTDGGSTWGADTRLTNDPANSDWPHIVVSDSVVHVAWFDNRDGNWEIYYKCSTNGGLTWGADTRLTYDPAISAMPCVVISGSNVYIVWQDARDGNNEIYYKLSTNGGVSWGEDTRLTYDPSVSWWPSISISNSVLHVVWSDYRDGNYEIYYKRNPTGNVGIQNISSEIPKEFKLFQNYPNPFNPTTKIKFDLPKSNLTLSEAKGLFVQLKIYDITGKEIQTLINEQLQPGTYEVIFDASNLSSGIYFYKLSNGNFSATKKLILLK